jgi:hypothetical protein
MTEVTGYIYQAEGLCAYCVQKAVIANNPHMGVTKPSISVSLGLARMAALLMIDTEREDTYDSDDFPKVVLSTDEGELWCGMCGEEI